MESLEKDAGTSGYDRAAKSGAKARITAIALAVLAGVVTVRDVARGWDNLHRWRVENPATHAQQRLAPLREYLPERGRIGYITDKSGEVDYKQEFFLARYVLAPLVLETPEGRHAFIVTDQDQAGPVLEVPAGYVVVADVGHGVRLWKRESP